MYILGAGFSGLLTGYEFSRLGYPVRVFDRLTTPGGLARTHQFDGYIIDSGPHLFHTSDRGIQSYWEALFPGVFRQPVLYSKNYVNGTYYDYPLSKETLRQLPPDIYNIIQSEMKTHEPEQLRRATSYKAYTEALAGPTLQRMFYQEYPEKVWGIPVEQLSPNWAPRRIILRDRGGPFHSGQWVGVPKRGCGQVMEILERNIRDHGGSVHYNTEITGLTTEGSSISSIQTETESIFVEPHDAVISTLPINTNASLLALPCSLWFRKLKLVCLVVNTRTALPVDADWLYFKDRNIPFHRVSSQCRFSDEALEAGLDVLCCEIAYSDGDAMDVADEPELVQRCINDLVSMGFLRPKNVIQRHLLDLGPVYPGFTIGYERDLQHVKGRLEAYHNFHSIGALAEFFYADLQILTAKALDLVGVLTSHGNRLNRIIKAKRPISRFNEEIHIGSRVIGKKHPPYVVAEIGLNHNGSVDLARALIDAAAEANCQAVKFQTFTKERLSAKVMKARYAEDLLDIEESLNQLFERLIFSYDDLSDLFLYARQKGLDVFSTPFDFESIDFLEKLDVPVYKISSMDLVNLPLIQAASSTMKPIILSTGMSSIGDIDEAVNIIMESGNPNLILLHCVSSYPCPVNEANLMAIQNIAKSFQTIVGFSDHFEDIYLVPPAIALGARVIEKHITLNKSMKGPDHVFSLEPRELSRLTEQTLSTFEALGNGKKSVLSSEYETMKTLRRSLFAKKDIEAGTTITEDMVVVKSPGIGLLPKYLEVVLGRQARREIKADHPITWDAI